MDDEMMARLVGRLREHGLLQDEAEATAEVIALLFPNLEDFEVDGVTAPRANDD